MVNNDYCKCEIAEIVENKHLTDDDKHAALQPNAEWFYKPQTFGLAR